MLGPGDPLVSPAPLPSSFLSSEPFVIQNKNPSQVVWGFDLLHKMSKKRREEKNTAVGKEWFNLVTHFLSSNYFFKNLGFAKSIVITFFPIMSTE